MYLGQIEKVMYCDEENELIHEFDLEPRFARYRCYQRLPAFMADTRWTKGVPVVDDLFYIEGTYENNVPAIINSIKKINEESEKFDIEENIKYLKKRYPVAYGTTTYELKKFRNQIVPLLRTSVNINKLFTMITMYDSDGAPKKLHYFSNNGFMGYTVEFKYAYDLDENISVITVSNNTQNIGTISIESDNIEAEFPEIIVKSDVEWGILDNHTALGNFDNPKSLIENFIRVYIEAVYIPGKIIYSESNSKYGMETVLEYSYDSDYDITKLERIVHGSSYMCYTYQYNEDNDRIIVHYTDDTENERRRYNHE